MAERPADDAKDYSPEAWHRKRSEVDEAPVRIFVMGVNRWRDEQEWPLARTRDTQFYLTSSGYANSLTGDGKLEWQLATKNTAGSFPLRSAQSGAHTGGAVCCNPKVFPWGPMDQRAVEKRRDVLVYTTAPLKADLEVTGPIRWCCTLSTSAPDTDFTAKLVDVFPDGEARNLTDGILRMRYRDAGEGAN